MRKSNASFKASKSIANKQNTKRIANQKGVSFKDVENVNLQIKKYLENKIIIDSFLNSTTKNLSQEIKEAAKTYFLFKLKNEQVPLRHNPTSDQAVSKKHALYKSYLEKLS